MSIRSLLIIRSNLHASIEFSEFTLSFMRFSFCLSSRERNFFACSVLLLPCAKEENLENHSTISNFTFKTIWESLRVNCFRQDNFRIMIYGLLGIAASFRYATENKTKSVTEKCIRDGNNGRSNVSCDLHFLWSFFCSLFLLSLASLIFRRSLFAMTRIKTFHK